MLGTEEGEMTYESSAGFSDSTASVTQLPDRGYFTRLIHV